MSKGQRGNKEAKKPKKVPQAVKPDAAVAVAPMASGPVGRERPKKK